MKLSLITHVVLVGAIACWGIACSDSETTPADDAAAATEEGATEEGAAAEPADGAAAEPTEEPVEEEAPAEPATYETPEAVFEAAKAAFENKDFAGFVNCMSPDKRGAMAGGLMMALGLVTKKDPELKAKVEELVKKHNLPDVSKMKGGAKKKMKNLAEAFEDPGAFIAEAMEMMASAKGAKKGSGEMYNGELTKLKIKGDNATAFVKPEKGKAKKVKFAKVDTSWYLLP